MAKRTTRASSSTSQTDTVTIHDQQLHRGAAASFARSQKTATMYGYSSRMVKTRMFDLMTTFIAGTFSWHATNPWIA